MLQDATMNNPNLGITFKTPVTDDYGDAGAELHGCTARQLAFANLWAQHGNKQAAYIAAYNARPDTAPNIITRCAQKIASLQRVQRVYDECVQLHALETVVDIREALRWQFDIATADPNEVCYTVHRACRHCYGVEHKYQWKNQDEFINACVEAMDAKLTPPTDEGGYGFTRALEPAHDCPECLGNGSLEIVVNDTTKLQGKARKLFKGLEYKNGEWVPAMHDQQKAWEFVVRMLGGFNDKLNLITHPRKGQVFPNDLVTEQDAARAYIEFIK